jgi:hypothetical protein
MDFQTQQSYQLGFAMQYFDHNMSNKVLVEEFVSVMHPSNFTDQTSEISKNFVSNQTDIQHKVTTRRTSKVVRFQVLTVESMKVTAFWVVQPCGLVDVPTFQRCVLPPSSGR